jgi:hypothetical protein
VTFAKQSREVTASFHFIISLMTACASFAVHQVPIGDKLPVQSESGLLRAVGALGSPVAISKPDSDVPIVQFFFRGNGDLTPGRAGRSSVLIPVMKVEFPIP